MAARVERLPDYVTARKRRILIAGGAGFLGCHLSDRLIEAGHFVVCMDNFLTGRQSNIEHLLGHPRFRLVTHDIIDPLPELGTFDQIYNLACAASPPLYQTDPIHTFRTNIIGALHLLELAERDGARILQSSTSEIYGDPAVSPQPETYFGNVNTVGPRSCHDEGKRAVETLFYEFQRQRNVRIRVARIFNTYGPRMSPSDGRVVSNFVVQALAGEDVTVYGDGSQTRSFCYVDDLIDGLIALMHAPDSVVGPVNLGNPSEFSVIELARIVVDTLGSRSRISFTDLPVDDPMQRKPDISRAQSLLGWAPRTSLKEGLARTIPYFAACLQEDRFDPMVAE
jgi:UDP-glucuronate decarboxylase